MTEFDEATSPGPAAARLPICCRLAPTETLGADAGRHGRLQRAAGRHVRRLVERGGVPRPLDIDELVARLEAHRERPIELRASAVPDGGPCGLWIRRPDHDVIVFTVHATGLHRDHIVLHEVGHMLADHRRGPAFARRPTEQPDTGLDLAEYLRSRPSYTAHEEHEAEMIANLIWLASLEDLPVPPGDVLQRRIEQAFGR